MNDPPCRFLRETRRVKGAIQCPLSRTTAQLEIHATGKVLVGKGKEAKREREGRSLTLGYSFTPCEVRSLWDSPLIHHAGGFVCQTSVSSNSPLSANARAAFSAMGRGTASSSDTVTSCPPETTLTFSSNELVGLRRE
jgi:hypothetical protein